jgi:hypothetical protein
MKRLLPLLLLAACVPEEPAVGPTPVVVRGPDAADVEVLGERADRLWPLPGGGVLVQRGTTLWRLEPDGTEVDLASEPGVVSIAGAFGDAMILFGEHGVFTLDTDGLRRSPLDEALAERPVHQLLAVGDALWLAADELLRWRDGELTALAPEDLPTANAVLAPARLPEGDGVFVLSTGTLYALVEQVAFRAWVEPVVPTAMATDAAGTLWAATDDGLMRRRPDGPWEELLFDEPVQALFGRDDRSEVWLQGERLVRFDGSEFRELEPALPLHALDGLGRALVLDGEPQRLSIDRPLLVRGAPDGTLAEPATLTLHPTLPDAVVSLSATIDGGRRSLERPWSLELDPLDFAEGPHRVELRVRYADRDEPVDHSVSFGVGTFEAPTWTDDVLPLHRAKCAECHDPGGTARLLSTPQQWAAEIDLVLANVEQDLMPLPPNEPLSPAEIQRIIGWAASGFPE